MISCKRTDQTHIASISCLKCIRDIQHVRSVTRVNRQDYCPFANAEHLLVHSNPEDLMGFIFPLHTHTHDIHFCWEMWQNSTWFLHSFRKCNVVAPSSNTPMSQYVLVWLSTSVEHLTCQTFLWG